MNEQERKKMIRDTFNTVAAGYDRHALRFFSESAKLLTGVLSLEGNEHVLDVATGTGCAALAIAQQVPCGRVTGIDFSEHMLTQARVKAAALNIRNTSFLQMDMQTLELTNNHYDAATCAFGIFFAEDMEQQLREISKKVKTGGKISVSGFHDDAFLPIVEAFFTRLQKYGIEVPPLSWKRIGTEAKVSALFQSAGLKDIRVKRKNIGYYLKNADEYWDIVWYAGFRGLVNQLSARDLELFKTEHLREVQAMSSKKGIWLNVEVLFTIGVKQ